MTSPQLRTVLENQTIALAGVAQAARIVDQLSRTGTYPLEFLEASVHSLFSFDAPDVESVFGNVQGVRLGLQNLAAGLASGGDETSASMMRYLFAILHLERKFAGQTAMQQVVQKPITAHPIQGHPLCQSRQRYLSFSRCDLRRYPKPAVVSH